MLLEFSSETRINTNDSSNSSRMGSSNRLNNFHPRCPLFPFTEKRLTVQQSPQTQQQRVTSLNSVPFPTFWVVFSQLCSRSISTDHFLLLSTHPNCSSSRLQLRHLQSLSSRLDVHRDQVSEHLPFLLSARRVHRQATCRDPRKTRRQRPRLSRRNARAGTG